MPVLRLKIGIDTSKPISRFQVLKLGMDEDMRTAGMKVGHRVAARRGCKLATPRAVGSGEDANPMQLVEELKNAGVELTPEVSGYSLPVVLISQDGLESPTPTPTPTPLTTPQSMQMLVKKMGPGWSKQEE